MNSDQQQIQALTQRVTQLEIIVTQLVERAGGYVTFAPITSHDDPGSSFPAAAASVSPYEAQVPGSAIPGVPDEVIGAILAGKKIQAIKYYRQFTGVGLQEAKEAVDAFVIQLGMR